MSWEPSSRGGSPYDGHLDLDDLELATSLDIVGDDAPRLTERLRERLERAGVTPWLRRHRWVVVTTVAVLVVAIAAGGVAILRRPVPLPAQPRVLLKVTGPDPTAQVEYDAVTGHPIGVFQNLGVTTAERPGVAVAIALAGPGIQPAQSPSDFTEIGRVQPDSVVPGVHGVLDCFTPESTTAVLGANPDDYGVDVRRTSPSGEVRVDRVAVIGGLTLTEVVRSGCLQMAADRDLVVSTVKATAVPGLVAADLVVTVTNDSPRRWMGLRVSLAASPQVVNAGPSPDLEPGSTGQIVARVWPDDCADPARALAGGLPVRPGLGPDGNPDTGSLPTPTLRLELPPGTGELVGRALTASCGTELPRLTVDRARLVRGAEGSSAGLLDIGATITAPDAAYVEAEAVGTTVVGTLAALQFPVRVRGEHARLNLQWELPGCADVLRGGRPQLTVTLVGEQRRPYLLALRGDDLHLVLSRLCGEDVAAVVR